MQKLAEVCIRRPVFAAMIILALVVVGATSYSKLGVDRFPTIDLPTVTIRMTLPGASPEEAESQLAKPIEEVVNTVEGVEQLRSVLQPGAILRHRDLQPEPRYRGGGPGCARSGPVGTAPASPRDGSAGRSESGQRF